MHIKKYTPQLLEIISYAKRDKDLELEVLVKSAINSETFYNVIKGLKGNKFVKQVDEVESLDIIADEDNIRVSVLGNSDILKYCEKNDIKSLNPDNLIFLQKTSGGKLRKVDINEYNIRFNLKRETELDRKSKRVVELLKRWNSVNKIFRYKKRISFSTTDDKYRFDLTVLKSSNKKSIRSQDTKRQKKTVKDYMIKYVKKPEYVTDKLEWFNSLKPTDSVTLEGRKIEIPIPSKNIKKANVFRNPLEYEIEIEYTGNKNGDKSGPKEVLRGMIMNLLPVLQFVNKSYYIIPEYEKNQARNEYKALMGTHKFSGPMNVTLEKKHMYERTYSDYENVVSIRKNYSVTDKADGERNLLIIGEKGKMYLLNRKNDIKYLGAECKELANTILDCEYILKDKEGNNINLVALFDAYFFKKEDIRRRILNRTIDEKSDGTIEKSRLEYLTDVDKVFKEHLVKQKSNNLVIIVKKFEYGDLDGYSPEIDKLIKERTEALNSVEVGSESYKLIENEIKELKGDSSIFERCEKIYKQEYIYEIDGLIFTPRNLFVGEERNNPTKKNIFSGRWYESFKWKPSDQNTIDFRVEIVKDDDGKTDRVQYNEFGGKIVPYKTLILKIGYSPRNHNRYNSCRVLNENLKFDDSYSDVPFVPTNPYIKDIEFANVQLKDNNIYTEDGTVVEDGMIIECLYTDKYPFNWSLLRARDNLTPNDFVTANNVWKCIHEPVTTDIITSGIIEDVNFFDNYYSKIVKRDSKKCVPMYDFHSFVKKKLIKENNQGSRNILDTSVGKGGDLNHWLDAEVNMLVGMDICYDGLLNENNGACNRVLNKVADLDDISLAENSMFIWADTSKDLFTGEAGNDDLNKYYLDVIFGNTRFEKITNSKLQNFYNLGNTSEVDGGFDLVSCQFSIHYYFKDLKSITTYLSNVSNSLKTEGRFVGTCLNGERVFEALRGKTEISSDQTNCWKITKKYKQSNFSVGEEYLGMEIDVYNESISATFTEYLVNMDFLDMLCEKYNLRRLVNTSFENIYSEIGAKGYGKSKQMDSDLKEYSFMNNAFVYVKF